MLDEKLKLSDYLTSPKYRRNSRYLVNDLDSIIGRKITKPNWWEKFSPNPRSLFSYASLPVTLPSYFMLSSIGKIQRAGILAKKLNFGISPNKQIRHDDVIRISAQRMMHRIYNARTYIGNEALYRHDGK